LALGGQFTTVVATAFVLQFPMPLGLCLGVIGVSALLNIALQLRAPKILRLADGPATTLLAFDIFQLAALLYLTGGLENPFSVLFLAPVTIAAVSLSPRHIVLIAALMATAASFLLVWRLPLPWHIGQSISLPWLYQSGFWIALLVACAFICAYASRVASEARSLSEALTAAELVLARENHLSQLDGLAAAAAHELGTPLATIALVVRELHNTAATSEFAEDLTLLTEEVQRCRSILGRLASLASEDRTPFSKTSLVILIEQVVEPNRQAGAQIKIDAKGVGKEPLAAHGPAILYGLGNFIENAVDFAKHNVTVEARWTENSVELQILDDGPGFSSAIVDRIGDPYVTSRSNRRIKREQGSGLGLGVFIAKTLLERTGATIKFANRENAGACVRLKWNRRRFESEND
jgi:two-component system sensor histidine kinase RegB